MDCHDATARFSDLRDGQLSGDELAELERHVTICPACRQEWAHFQEAVEALHGLGPVEPGLGFAARIRAQIEAPPWHTRLARHLFMPWKVKLPIEAAALAILAVGTVLIYQRSPEMRQAVEQPKVPQPPAPIEANRRDAVQMGRPAFRKVEKAEPESQIGPLAREAPRSRADEAVPQAKPGAKQPLGPTVSEQPASEKLSPAAQSPPEGRAAVTREEVSQPLPPPTVSKDTPTDRFDYRESSRPLAAHTPARDQLAPFRVMTLRTQDVAAAEERIREWIGLVGGRLLDPPVSGEPTPPGPRALSLIVPRQAVQRLDALLAELGQLLGRELEVPPSNEVLISLTLSPKPPPPSSGSE
ncbi:MAG: zf-HC2 domain-containing protein [Candidatus Methylomirabilis sp.]